MAERRTDESARTGRVRLAIGGLTPQTRPALETAVRLALEAGDGIDCLFVEENTLFQAAALPITRELAVFTGRVQRFEPGDVERALRRQAADARRLLAQAALRARLRFTFEVVRGALLAEALSRAGEQDVIVIGLPGWLPDAPPRELEREALAALAGETDWSLRRRGGTLVARPVRRHQ